MKNGIMSIEKSNRTYMDTLRLIATAVFLFILVGLLYLSMNKLGFTEDIQNVIYQTILWSGGVIYVILDRFKRFAPRYKVIFSISGICVITLYWVFLIKLKHFGINLILLPTPLKLIHAVVGVFVVVHLCDWSFRKYAPTVRVRGR